MAEKGDLIAIVSTEGAILNPVTLEGGLTMAPAEMLGMLVPNGNWRLRGVGDGIAGWWRFVGYPPDDGGDNPLKARIDGSVGESLLLPDNQIFAGQLQDIESFTIFFPSE